MRTSFLLLTAVRLDFRSVFEAALQGFIDAAANARGLTKRSGQ